MSGDFGGLIEASGLEPVRVEWHGDDEIGFSPMGAIPVMQQGLGELFRKNVRDKGDDRI